MRVPKIENYSTENKFVVKNIKNIPSITRDYVLLNDKDKVKFIKMIERIVRSSLEYKQYIRFLKDEIDMTECSFFNNVSNKNGSKVSIEIHHEPFTLFDIAQIVTEKYIRTGTELNPLDIAEEVMILHYKNHVGLIPLSITVHQLVHDGKLFIPLQNVFGKYTKFIEEYRSIIETLDVNNILRTKFEMSKDLTINDMTLLETKYVYLDIDGFSFPQMVA